MRALRALSTLALAGGLLAACGSGPSRAYAPSRDCTVSVTNADYNGCDFAHRDLAGADLQQDSFLHANLDGADLAGADLQGAKLAGATYRGAVTTKTTVCVNAQFGPCTLPGLKGKRAIAYG